MISKLHKAEVEISKGHATAQAANFSIPEEAMAEIEGRGFLGTYALCALTLVRIGHDGLHPSHFGIFVLF